MSKNDEKIKVINPNPFNVGLRLVDGREILVTARKNEVNGANFLEMYDLEHIENTSAIFKKAHLIVEDEAFNERYGYSVKSIASYTDAEILALLKANITKIKKDLESVTEKHLIDKVIGVAKTVEDLAKNKITFLQEWSGYDFDQLISDEKEEENKTK